MGNRDSIPGRDRNSTLQYRVQTGLMVHPAFCPVVAVSYFSGVGWRVKFFYPSALSAATNVIMYFFI
jgi:hypothetical protein